MFQIEAPFAARRVATILALTRLELSYAYPFTSLSFVLIFIASVVLFHEPVSTTKLIGMALIVCGLVVGSR